MTSYGTCFITWTSLITSTGTLRIISTGFSTSIVFVTGYGIGILIGIGINFAWLDAK